MTNSTPNSKDELNSDHNDEIDKKKKKNEMDMINLELMIMRID